jgi:hypothetical protein
MGERAENAWEKAAACEKHAQRTFDARLKALFLKFRDSWIRIGNEAQFDEDVIENEERLNERTGRNVPERHFLSGSANT